MLPCNYYDGISTLCTVHVLKMKRTSDNSKDSARLFVSCLQKMLLRVRVGVEENLVKDRSSMAFYLALCDRAKLFECWIQLNEICQSKACNVTNNPRTENNNKQQRQRACVSIQPFNHITSSTVVVVGNHRTYEHNNKYTYIPKCHSQVMPHR